MFFKHSFTNKIEVPPFLQALCQELGDTAVNRTDQAGRREPNKDERHMAASAVREPQQGNAVERSSWGRPGNSQERCSWKGPELGTTNSKVPK